MKLLLFVALSLLMGCASDALQPVPAEPSHERPVSRLLYRYEPSDQCGGCHAEQLAMYRDSMHAKAFTNPLFNAQYFNDVVPRAQRDRRLIPEARRCIACHAPIVFMNYTGLVSTPAQARYFETGVTCDFCHTLAGYDDDGDYLQVKSGRKQGPFEVSGAATHHSEYSEFMQRADFCGRCHDATNHIGLEVKSTYSEWRGSSYARDGVTCQECHMNRDGFLKKGVAEFDRGPAARMNIGAVARKQKEHVKLYNHSFPGAHSPLQLEDALSVDFRIGVRSPDASGQFPFSINVNNERSGHKMPSGSSDLRFMWLVVTATTADGKQLPVALDGPPAGKAANYAVAGASPADAEILQNDVPPGVRLYRSVLVDAEGQQSLYQPDSVRHIFDNRLNAAEVRKEGYLMSVPTGFSGKVLLEASLYYKGSPGSFTRHLLLPDSATVKVASGKKQIIISPYHDPDH